MDYDALLKRNLLPGKKFDSLFPPSTCKVEFLGTGLTDFTIDQMEDWVLDNYQEAKKVAKELQQSSLSETCKKIHWFLFNHFQYNADLADQYLRAPACAWHSRHEGMDCKSFSIVASCILLNLDVLHYIRKIKQLNENPNDYTHVYVIVPKDQVNGNLEKGYYTIDGTLANTAEPFFTEKSDLKMSLQHYGLKGTPNQGLGLSIGNLNLGNLFSNISCIGGSSLDGNALRVYIGNVETYYKDLFSDINDAVIANDMTNFSLYINEFFGNTKMLAVASQRNRNKGWNACTNRSIDEATKTYKFYENVVGAALNSWLSKYFNESTTGQAVQYTSAGAEAKYGFRHLNVSPAEVVNQPLKQYSFKGIDVPAFQITNYIAQLAQTYSSNKETTFNAVQFLQGLTTTIAAFSPTPSEGQTATGQGNYSSPNTDLQFSNQPQPTTQTAGFGMIGWIVLLGSVGYAFTQMKDNGTGAKK